MPGTPLTEFTTTGIDNAVPQTRTLTIGGITYDLSADRTWSGGGGGGSVTSVAMSVPTGFSIAGSPITTSGTLALTFAAGYSLPLNTKQSNWDDAYTWVAAFPTQSGNAGKYLTTNGSTLSWVTISGGGITSLNTLTAGTQTFATGTAGTDFGISSTTSTHTFNLPTASGTNRGALSSSDWTLFNNKQSAISLTTTGSSGAATFVSNVLNIPNYTLAGLGGVPTTRTLTINGTGFDLSADRSWTISAAITDGDKGDISVTGSGATWTIDPAAVTYAKIQNVAANSFLANATGTAASVQEIATNRIPLFGSAITGTPSATTFLRGDGSWQTPSGGGGTPGGSTNQVQFNNAGAFGGASRVEIEGGDLSLVEGAFPSNPSTGRTKLFTDSMGGRFMLGSLNSVGNHYDLQPALFNGTTYMWLPGTGTTLAINWGASFTARNSGTQAAQSTPAKTSTSAITSLNRANFSTGTTATGASGIQTTELTAWLGNSAGLGGFFFCARIGVETLSGTYRVFCGLSANNAALAADPSTINNTIGFGKDAADANWQIITKGVGTANKINTSVAVTQGTIYDFYMNSEPFSSSIIFEIRNSIDNTILYTSSGINTNLPANTLFMYMQAHIQSASGTTAKLLALNKMYLETNL